MYDVLEDDDFYVNVESDLINPDDESEDEADVEWAEADDWNDPPSVLGLEEAVRQEKLSGEGDTDSGTVSSMGGDVVEAVGMYEQGSGAGGGVPEASADAVLQDADQESPASVDRDEAVQGTARCNV